MQREAQLRRVIAGRWILRLISLIVQRSVRSPWFAGREANLRGISVLSERGELVGNCLAQVAWCWREAFANAVFLRYGSVRPARWLRSAGFPLIVCAVIALAIGWCTHGLAETRALWHAFGNARNLAQQDRLVAYDFPIVFGLLAGVMTMAGRISIRGCNWRYTLFFVTKAFALEAIAILLWIEGGSALRACIPNQTVRVLAGGLLYAILFVTGMCAAVLWSIADQQHRCGVCLRRLVMPVRIGIWGSVFEPVTTEWLCEDGHGMFCESASANDARQESFQKLTMTG